MSAEAPNHSAHARALLARMRELDLERWQLMRRFWDEIHEPDLTKPVQHRVLSILRAIPDVALTPGQLVDLSGGSLYAVRKALQRIRAHVRTPRYGHYQIAVDVREAS